MERIYHQAGRNGLGSYKTQSTTTTLYVETANSTNMDSTITGN